MTTREKQLTQIVTDSGIAADHDALQEQRAMVGPATASEFNTIKAGLVPIACWRVEDMRFEFDSSFVMPEIAAELRQLAALRKRLPESPLSVFAHADPVGDDVYNKTLSGRRALAIYALLTRRVDMWEELFSNPFGNDKWGEESLETMAETVSAPPDKSNKELEQAKSDSLPPVDDQSPGCPIFTLDAVNAPASKAAAPDSASQSGRAQKSVSDKAVRSELFRAYMDRLCGPDLELKKEEFLGRGADAGGKADFQGCSEFNPILLFSLKEQQEFSKPSKKGERDEENSPNRRVLVFLFRKGTQINPQLWPCPRAKEGPAGCRKRFWSDAEKRRGNQADRREYSKTRDTFACRFYDRLAHASPCETGRIPLRIRLYDTKSRFIPNAAFRLALQGQPLREGNASRRGFVTLRPGEGAGEGFIEWGFPAGSGESQTLLFQDRIFLDFPSDPEQLAERKLVNLGYGGTAAPRKARITAFQSDYREEFGLQVTGTLDADTLQAVDEVHDGMADQLRKRPT